MIRGDVDDAAYRRGVILDQSIPGGLLPQCVGLASGAVCDAMCAQTLGSFDGSELVADLYGMDDSNGISGILTQCRTHIPTLTALSVRGALLLTTAGRLGIGIGYGRVVEPAGRQYAMVMDPASRYQLAYDSGFVVYTVGAIL